MTTESTSREAHSHFPLLFSPLRIGRLSLRNRIVMLPHGTSMVSEGVPTDDDNAYYALRARSGVGLVITGAAVSSLDSTRRGRKLVELYSEHALSALARRAEAVRAHGAAIVGQVVHLGRESIGGEGDYPLIAPSPIRSPRDLFAPHEMSVTDIRRVIQDFANCSSNLEKTGHSGVEIHGAHGYLVAQFLSPATNHREDAYGGDATRRMRFLFELIDAIRGTCGSDFVLGLRLSAEEELADGLEVADSLRIAEAIASAHPVDYLSITVGVRGAYVKDVTQPDASTARASGLIRDASGLPTIVGQRITSPGLGEKLLREGKADAIGFARLFISDGDWVSKAAEGREDRIRPCIGLNQDCRAFAPHLHCAVNPLAGREMDPAFASPQPAAARRRVGVIGGGPAGMEAARLAALRGHEVTLYEASDGLGGQFLYASSVPKRSGLRRIIDHLQAELRNAPIEIVLNRRVMSPNDFVGGHDVIVLATGAVPSPIDVTRYGGAPLAWFDILRDGAPAPFGGSHVLVHDDGSGFWWTYGVADALAEAGWRVTLTTPSASIAAAIPAESLAPLLVRLGRGGARYAPLSEILHIGQRAVDIVNIASGVEERLEVDLVVIQTGRCSLDSLRAVFDNAGLEFFAIGDCVAPRRISHALMEAHRLALAL